MKSFKNSTLHNVPVESWMSEEFSLASLHTAKIDTQFTITLMFVWSSQPVQMSQHAGYSHLLSNSLSIPMSESAFRSHKGLLEGRCIL